jgi:2-methylcitrate dehydratase
MCDSVSIRARGWDHVTYGCFSSALGAGLLLGLDVDRLEHAVNIAGVNAAAMRQTRVGQLSMWKGCAFANAARQGVFAAVLAAEGLTGPDEIFEGPMGFCQQVSGPLELDIENWGPPSMITRTSIKFWPAEYHSQSAIDAALQLRGQIGDPSQIQALRIFSFDAAVDIIGSEVEKWRPTSRETADHSMPYCVAVALLDGEVGLGQFTDERIARDDVRALMDRITILRDPALTTRYPEGIPNRLEVTLADGRVLECEVTFPRGHDHNPMTDDEVIAKFRSLAGLQLPEAQVNELIQRVWTLETQDPGALLAATTVPQGAS